MGEHPPVKDWATDFDHTDEVWAADPYPIWDELRQTCPIAHSDRYGGTWLPTRHEDVAAIAYDTDNFTSQRRRHQLPAAQPGAQRDRPADLFRPAVPRRRPADPAAADVAADDRQVGAVD